MVRIGTVGNDRMIGTAGADIIDGGRGNDSINGMAGNDSIRGGDGNDWVQGGSGNDTIWGGDGRDSLLGGEGDDVLHGGSGGIDFLFGGSGADLFIVLAGDANPADCIVFTGNRPVDQWIQLYDVNFTEGDRVALQDGDAGDGSLDGFIDLAAAGVTNQRLDSLAEWKALGQYLQSLGADRVYDNAQQNSLTFFLEDHEGQMTAVEFFGYRMTDLI